MGISALKENLFVGRDDRTKHWALIDRINNCIATSVDLKDVLSVAAEEVGRNLDATRAVIIGLGEYRLRFAAAYNSSNTATASGATFAAVEEEITSGISDQTRLIEIDAESDPKVVAFLSGLTKSSTSGQQIKSILIAPISIESKAVATLIIYRARGKRFSEQEKHCLQAIASALSLAIHQARLKEMTRIAVEREAMINRLLTAIRMATGVDDVLKVAVEAAGTALGVARTVIYARSELGENRFSEQNEFPSMTARAEYRASVLVPSLLGASLIIEPGLNREQFLAGEMIILSDTEEKHQEARALNIGIGVRALALAPVAYNGETVAALALEQCNEPRSFSEEEIALVRLVAEQTAVALYQAELYRKARESAEQATQVNLIVSAIRRSLDLQEALKVAVQELGRALGANRTNFRKLTGDEMVVVAEYVDDPALSMQNVPAKAGDYLMRQLDDSRRTLIIDDVPAFIARYPEQAATVRAWQVETISLSEIICPIFVNDQFWGALSIVQTDCFRKWNVCEIAMVELITAQIEVAVSHGHLFEETRQAAQREALISHIIHGINQSNRLSEIFPLVAGKLAEYLSVDKVLIGRLDQKAGTWAVECQYSRGETSRPVGTISVDGYPDLGKMLETDSLICADVEADPRFAPYIDRLFGPLNMRALVAVGVFYRGAPRLTITAAMENGPREWTDDEVEIMRAAANQVFIALERAELFEQVSHGKHEWEATFDALTDGIFIFDQQGLLKRVNKMAANLEGTSIQELLGRRCCTLMQGIQGEECMVSKVLKTGKAITFELVPEHMARPVLVTISPVISQVEKDSLGAVCIVRDLSELRAAEAVAREQRGFLAKLIEHANDAIFAVVPEGRLVWFNEQLTTLSGYSREELTNAHCWLFIPPEDKNITLERFARVLAGQAQTFEMRGLTREGEARLLLVTYTPIYDEGRVSSVLGIARDITEDRLASERAAQAEKLRALGQLASGVAHNFNNILAAVLGHAQLMKRDCKDERAIQRLEIIESAALDGAQTVKRIQGFGLQQDQTVYGSIDVNQLIQDSTTLTCARWRDDAQARGINYEVDLDLKQVPPALGSASELREVFVNLILNALDAMPMGGRLRIVTEAKDSLVKVSFIDSGVGMNREVRRHIFEPFFTTKGAKGMGLGLAVSYSIIERHSGRFEVRSVLGRGSTFAISLPTGSAALKKMAQARTSSLEAASILVIDDDERVREAMAGMLNSTGHYTEEAASGSEALAKLETGKFDLVFTDLAMPEMDGWAVAREIRRRWPDTKIVLITGYALPPETVKHRHELVNEVLFKPIHLDDIKATLSQVLSC